jgi:hypothetical protein
MSAPEMIGVMRCLDGTIMSVEKSKYIAYTKKRDIACGLLDKTFPNQIVSMFCRDGGIVELIFKNKIQQKVSIEFLCQDPWDKIKAKVQKLIDADGVCVVCMEKEKGERKKTSCCMGCPRGIRESIKTYTHLCQSCCEYVCAPCFEKLKDTKCPVCRQCVHSYKHSYFGEKCHCNEPRCQCGEVSDDDEED